jgi:hypothetical protein
VEIDSPHAGYQWSTDTTLTSPQPIQCSAVTVPVGVFAHAKEFSSVERKRHRFKQRLKVIQRSINNYEGGTNKSSNYTKT